MIHKCFLSFLLMLLHHKSPRVSRPQQPIPHTHIHTLTHTNHDCPLSGIRASFWWLILASWHQSSIPQLPCKTLSLTTHFTSKTTANALVHNITAYCRPLPGNIYTCQSVCFICILFFSVFDYVILCGYGFMS